MHKTKQTAIITITVNCKYDNVLNIKLESSIYFNYLIYEIRNAKFPWTNLVLKSEILALTLTLEIIECNIKRFFYSFTLIWLLLYLFITFQTLLTDFLSTSCFNNKKLLIENRLK